MFKPLVIKDLVAKVPLIQGGMGIGISLSRLAGTVAKEGGIGILSTAQIGYRRDDFEKNSLRSNWQAIKEEFDEAKRIAKGGIVGFNIMVAQFQYEKIVQRCVEIGADVIISGAGLPVNLPELVEGSKTKIAPIVSSAKGAKVLLKTWAKRYNRTADFVVIEGPKAGGHLGFKADDIQSAIENMDNEVKKIVEIVKEYAETFKEKVPVIFAGGVFTQEDIQHYLSLGCDGVQMATRFVATEECDAPDDFKERYINAKEEDVKIIKSPVGLPGRAIHNSFYERIQTQTPIPIEKCRNCLSYKHCDRKTIPYCISEFLLKAVNHDTENALLFAGANVYRVNEITTVKKLIDELFDR
ncbi:NAD(P)H-dependent flavin oxidoreductase YrpB, nitropropane dioxygenase family [Pilibacter termitis]|uniref:Probable nitronate monooxygenase n=1 Tax=Pilibacter termitis TaxID=263852 RepID=A0A1T4KZC0_9ENTE|nr:nitronate monooxygenase family protein [Pilibacter termitis]SJZ47698.1 NAD(P)H-dependent flavin oxidoreductase YrpB, nitropropane dioxygenase family [Pilibacter termitis]